MKDRSYGTAIIIITLITGLLATNGIWINYSSMLQRELDIEREDRINAEVALAETENEVYDLSIKLKSTNKTLAETAAELDRVVTNDLEKNGILNLDYIGELTCTAYCCEKYPHICGTGTGKTASGAPVTPDVSVAVGDLEMFPFGTVLYIEGVGIRIVQDQGNFDCTKLDVAVDTHEHALNWEKQGKHKVWIVEVGK